MLGNRLPQISSNIVVLIVSKLGGGENTRRTPRLRGWGMHPTRDQRGGGAPSGLPSTRPDSAPSQAMGHSPSFRKREDDGS